MKTSAFLIPLPLLLLAGSLFTGCKKTTDAKPTETAINSFLTSETAVTSGVRTSGPWELGVVFSSSVAGKLTQVGSKMPEPGSYRVIVWDFDSKAILRQQTIEQTSPNLLKLESVESLALTPNKKYLISINSQSGGTNRKYAYASKTNGADFMPFTKGSILVYNACFSGVATATFPSATPNIKSELYGYPEFTFIPD